MRAGRPGDLEQVCPQRFVAPLAPHLAAREEGRELDANLLRAACLEYWRTRAEIILVEGARRVDVAAGGKTCTWPQFGEEFGFPLVVVARECVGTINQTPANLDRRRPCFVGIPVAGVVLNNPTPACVDDVSLATESA